jgi:2-keto-4-pentenoate hydratase/2-oxohepta-3-ene-1,7-dioic acid hydratase in catechol pathway
MDRSRRGFLKSAAVAGAATAVVAPQAGCAQMPPSVAARPAAPTMVRGLTLLNMRQGDAATLGVKTDKGILDVARAATAFKTTAPKTTDDVVQYGDQGLGALVASALRGGAADLFVDEARITHAPAIMRPEKIVCVGLNYARHARETNNPIPKLPILFNKFNNTLNTHRGMVRVSGLPGQQFDYEAELVVVMGRRASNVSEADALSYVMGYATGNDFTARDLQSRSSQWMIGKTNDGFAPIGPYLVAADLVGDPNALKIECLVNGGVRQSSNTNDMVFNCAQIVSYTSTLFTLEPGDIIFTGTPEGVIAGYPKDKQVWLKPGDKLVTRIEKLGNLEFELV